MGTIIRSTIPVSYSVSNPVKQAIVEIDFYKWSEINGEYIADIRDYWIQEVTETRPIYDINGVPTGQTETITYEKRTLIEPRSVKVSIPTLNYLAGALEPLMDGMNEHERREFQKAQGALLFVKSDFLDDGNGNVTSQLKYNTTDSDWFIKT